MASRGEGSEPLQSKTWVLKVSIHCEGCKKKVKKILQSVDGVHTIDIDSKQNKAIVTGNVEGDVLIRKLVKSGKPAELWPIEKKPNKPNPDNNSSPIDKDKGKSKAEEKDVEKEKDKDKEKDVSRSNEPKVNPQKNPDSNKEASNSNQKPEKAPSSETETKQADTAAITGGNRKKKGKKPVEVSNSDHNTEKAPSSETETKRMDNATKSPESGKKKGKQPLEAADGGNEEFVMNSGGMQPVHQQPPYQTPPYAQPVYAASYNMVQPSASYSYYAQMPPMPQQNYMYSGHPPQYYSNYPPENYYYGSMEPAPSSVSSQSNGYDFLNEENPNACHVM